MFTKAAPNFFLIGVLFLAGVRGDELRFAGGPVVTGRLESHEAGKYTFLASGLGKLIIPDSVATVATGPAASASPNPTRPPEARPAAAAAVPETEKPRSPWSGKVEFGYLNEAGPTTLTTATLAASLDYRLGRNNLTWTECFDYGKSNDAVSSQREDASFRFRHDLGGRFFSQAISSYTSDRVRRIHYQFDQDGGIGYRVLANDWQNASAGVSLAAEDRSAFGTARTLTPLGKIFEDWTVKLTPQLTFAEAGNAQASPQSRDTLVLLSNNQTTAVSESAKNYMFQVQSSVESKISRELSLVLKFEYDYDNAVADPLLRAEDRMTSSVAYSF